MQRIYTSNVKDEKFIHIRVDRARHEEVKKHAVARGMTLSGMIRFALKKVFGIEL